MTMAAKMKGFKKRTLVLGVVAAWGLFSAQAQADQLADIKAAGVVKVATFDANPPFGSIDAKTHEIVGYDVDFAKALATSLGVKLELVATNSVDARNGKIEAPILQAGRDILYSPEQPDSLKAPKASYDAVPKWRSPFTQAVLSWIGVVLVALGIVPIS